MADTTTKKTESDDSGVKQDWIITVKLVETCIPAANLTKRELEYEVQSRLEQIVGVKVRQVMIAPDGPRYY